MLKFATATVDSKFPVTRFNVWFLSITWIYCSYKKKASQNDRQYSKYLTFLCFHLWRAKECSDEAIHNTQTGRTPGRSTETAQWLLLDIPWHPDFQIFTFYTYGFQMWNAFGTCALVLHMEIFVLFCACVFFALIRNAAIHGLVGGVQRYSSASCCGDAARCMP